MATKITMTMKRNILTTTGNSAAPFLGFGVGKTTGPVVLRLRARPAAGSLEANEWVRA